MPRRLLSLVMGLSFASAVWSFDTWPQWRGPERNGISRRKGLLNEWKGPPPLLWKAQGLGTGYAGAVIDRGIVCTMGIRKGKATVIALGDKDGKEVWATSIADSGGRAFSSMCTPTIDGDRV